MKGEDMLVEKIPLEPQEDRVVVIKTHVGSMTKGGLIVPLQLLEGQWVGRVVAVGPGRWIPGGDRQPIPFKVGDLVVPGRSIEREFLFEGVNYIVMKVHDIVAKLVDSVQECKESKVT